MNHPLPETPYYSRTVPVEWNGLLKIAQGEMARHARPEPSIVDSIEAIRSVLVPLSDEQIDTNRYFGLGLALCGLAKALRQPDVKRRLIVQAGNSLGKSWQSTSAIGEPGAGNDASVMNKAFRPLVYAAINDMAPGARLLTDTLIITTEVRRHLHTNPESHEAHQVIEELIASGALYNHPTAEQLSQNVTSGTLALFYSAMDVKGKGIERLKLDASDRSKPEVHSTTEQSQHTPAAAEPMTSQELRNLNLRKAAFRIATLRLDEAARAFDTYLAVDPDGQVFIPKDFITPKQELAPPDPAFQPLILHTLRLKCPAVHVQGLIDTLIDIVPEILIEAGQHRGQG